MKTLQALAVVLTLALQSLAQTAEPTVIEIGPNQRVWSNPSGDRRAIVELGTGMNYWDGQKWTPSDPSFDVTDNAFVASRLQTKVSLAANLNQIAAVTVVTPDGITLKSTPVGIGLYDPVTGKAAIVGT